MKRRDFLKVLTAVPVVAVVPVLAKANNSGEFPENYIDALKYDLAKREHANPVILDSNGKAPFYMFGESSIQYDSAQSMWTFRK